VEYSDNPYGDNFADIYDEWYRDLDNIDAVVSLVLSLAENGSVYELGIGTGRLALPIALAGKDSDVRVSGIDSSQAMLDQLSAKPDSELIDARLGHMVRDMAPGPFSVVLLAYNTLFNLLSAQEQQQCLLRCAASLAPGGHIIVDCFVPSPDMPEHSGPTPHRSSSRGYITSEVHVDKSQQLINGVFVEVVEEKAVRREWKVRYASTQEIDAMASHAGLQLEQRWETYSKDQFSEHSRRHISVYGKATLINP
jgi:SAM-dependent methyltransferase